MFMIKQKIVFRNLLGFLLCSYEIPLYKREVLRGPVKQGISVLHELNVYRSVAGHDTTEHLQPCNDM